MRVRILLPLGLCLLLPSLLHATPWRKRQSPVWKGQYGIAGDPAVLKTSARYEMTYTCPDPEHLRAALCRAISPNGLNWQTGEGLTDTVARGLIFRGRPGEWDENVETGFAVRRGAETRLYYGGYRQGGEVSGASLGLAIALGPGEFVPVGGAPILAPTPGSYDSDALYSPVVLRAGAGWVMLYAGHCYRACAHQPGVTVLGAISADGLAWTKHDGPVLAADAMLSWMRDGAAEPALLVAPDGTYRLFFTGLRDDARVIGMATSGDVFGPWKVQMVPILTPSRGTFDQDGVLAPDVRLEGRMLRLWYLGDRRTSRGDLQHAVGYAEALWPG